MMTECETRVGYNCTKTGPKMDKVSSQCYPLDEPYFNLRVKDDAIAKSLSPDSSPQRQQDDGADDCQSEVKQSVRVGISIAHCDRPDGAADKASHN